MEAPKGSCGDSPAAQGATPSVLCGDASVALRNPLHTAGLARPRRSGSRPSSADGWPEGPRLCPRHGRAQHILSPEAGRCKANPALHPRPAWACGPGASGACGHSDPDALARFCGETAPPAPTVGASQALRPHSPLALEKGHADAKASSPEAGARLQHAPAERATAPHQGQGHQAPALTSRRRLSPAPGAPRPCGCANPGPCERHCWTPICAETPEGPALDSSSGPCCLPPKASLPAQDSGAAAANLGARLASAASPCGAGACSHRDLKGLAQPAL
mmetsp:Transcript_12431/g.27546  ORF Transcript_12431/g.27546 Transcript_12431/m.27546 type:complete len:276 (+) Transcript_12431:764-1591(+)